MSTITLKPGETIQVEYEGMDGCVEVAFDSDATRVSVNGYLVDEHGLPGDTRSPAGPVTSGGGDPTPRKKRPIRGTA